MKREDKAARLIQRIFRGRLARHAMRTIRRNRAARKIQGMWRGRAGRQLYMAQLRQIRGIRLQVREGVSISDTHSSRVLCNVVRIL